MRTLRELLRILGTSGRIDASPARRAPNALAAESAAKLTASGRFRDKVYLKLVPFLTDSERQMEQPKEEDDLDPVELLARSGLLNGEELRALGNSNG